MNWREFEELARKTMSQYFNVELIEKSPKGFPKKFDLVSPDNNIVGDAKYLTLVNREKLPPAKFMEIAGHCWLLEKVETEKRFLVFGNQIDVPEKWLKKYGKLVKNIEFYFIDNNGNITKLNENK